MPFEIVRAEPQPAADFARAHSREGLRTFYGFPVVWHDQQHHFAAVDGGEILAIATIEIAASLAAVRKLLVAPDSRRRGIGRALLAHAADVANYYNCHKMTAEAVHRSPAQQFLEACGYHQEAVLAQHAFKLDVAVLRKFLL